MRRSEILEKMKAGFEMLLQQDPWGRPLAYVILRDPSGAAANEQVMWWQVERLLADKAIVLDGETREVSRQLVLSGASRNP